MNDDVRNTRTDGGRSTTDLTALAERVVGALEGREATSGGERERLADLFGLLGRAHALAVLATFASADGPQRFSDLEEALEVTPSTLSARLSELTEAGLLERETFDEVPPRVEYEPTEAGRALFPAFGYLHAWASEHAVET